MQAVRIISEPQDSTFRPLTRTVKDALAAVIDRGEMPSTSRAKLVVRPSSDPTVFFSALSFDSTKGDHVWFALPISTGFCAKDTFDRATHKPLSHLDGAEVDSDGNLSLSDGTFVHSVSLDILPLHFELPEMEEAIVYLTIRFLKAPQCFRIYENIFFGVDYGELPKLSVPNVKALVLYVNKHINEYLTKKKRVTVAAATVHRTLDLVGIRKVQGRPKSKATYRRNTPHRGLN